MIDQIYLDLNQKGIKVNRNRLSIDRGVNIQFGMTSIDIAELEDIILFNRKMIKLCGRDLNKCDMNSLVQPN